ncbi:hypothetical protein GGQ73_000714 [Rhizobium skierniewicense]|uniref:Uncharacterized protein n=1 Tax=Rhizobium skierniewicense TaxID=984260 RepID=A0A7W6C8F3_9HYPH|nr:hypothetical protein [Rhizobium skierniewicense]
MPWMGKNRWTPRYSKRLIGVFAAGMLVFIGIQASVSVALTAKLHRLESSQRPQAATSLAHNATSAQRHDSALWTSYARSVDHDFVDPFLPNIALVSGDMNDQIGAEDMQFGGHGLRLTGTVSPRGPPRGIS